MWMSVVERGMIISPSGRMMRDTTKLHVITS